MLGALTSGVALACFIAGGAALWLWNDPVSLAELAETTPWRLFGLLGLFVLPAATIAFQALDRRDAAHQDDDATPESEPAPHPAPRIRRHDHRGRRRPTPTALRSRSSR